VSSGHPRSERRPFDRVADVYDRTRAMPPDAADAVTAGIVAAVGAGARVLEVGVGTGRIAAPLAAAGLRMVGVDVSMPMLDRLRDKRSAVRAVVGDVGALPFRAGCVDAALLVHVLHLVPDARRVLREAWAAVRAGGAVLLGRTEHGRSRRRGVIELAWRIVEDVGGPARPAMDWNAAAVAAFADVASERRTTIDERVVARWTERGTGRQLLDAFAARTYSRTWAIPDEMMSAVLGRLEPALRDAVGDLERPVESEASFVLTIARPRDDAARS
jgi:ubiquinone/menaquinone biosynthesis C-methylase UbiE